MASLKEAMANTINVQKMQGIFDLEIYGLAIFSKMLGYVEVAMLDLISRLCCNINSAPAITTKTIRALNFCKKMTRRFIGCALMLHLWLVSHLCPKEKKEAVQFFP